MNRLHILLLVLLTVCKSNAQTVTVSVPAQFDTILVNTSDSLAFWVRNPGPTPFTVTDINATRAEFRIKDTAFTVPANDSVRVYVHFTTNQNVTWKDVLLVTGTGLKGSLPLQWRGTGRIADGAYNATQGLWENALKTALTNLVTGHTNLGYDVARNRMFETVDDVNLTDTIECVYTGRRIRAVNRTEAQNQNFDTEHTWPQGTFNSADPMRSDLNHLFPTYSPANSQRGSYPFGPVVSSITYQEGGSKKGLNSNGVISFEPRDVQKGDVARALFYFMLRYQNNYEGYLDQPQETYLRQWHTSDPVNAKELQRNTRLASYQGKRNPLVDYPQFVERITSFRSATAPTLYPDILASASAINFGTVAVGDSIEWTLIIINNGRAALTLSGLTLQSPSSNFRIVNTPTGVPVDSFASVRVRFIPTQSNQSSSNTVIIQSNDPDEGTVNIALSGTGSSGTVQTLLNFPANSATAVPTPVLFTWYRPSGADQYHFQLSLSNTFSSFIANDSTLVDSSASPAGLALNTTYHWRVRSHAATGWGTFSATRSFTTWTTPAQVLLLNPADAATNTPIPTIFEWQSTALATRYHFDLDTTSSFISPIDSDTTLTAVSRTASGLSLGTTYYWRVRAGNGAGWSTYAPTRSFTSWSLPDQAQLVSPADSTEGVPIPAPMYWQSTPTATRYQLDLSLLSSFVTVLVTDSSLTDTTRLVSELESNTTYYWRVRSGNGAGWGAFAGTRSFTTGNPPAQVQLGSPANLVRGIPTPVVFSWQPSPDATIYNFELSQSGSFGIVLVSDSSLTDTLHTVSGLDTLTTYYWRVRARNNFGWGPFSQAWEFRIASVFTLTKQMNAGWSLVSVPVLPPDSSTAAIFPTAVSAAYLYNAGYVQSDTLSPGVGYWMKFGQSEVISISGEPLSTDTIEVSAGWNLIGSISYPLDTSTIVTLPSGIIMSPFFGFNDGYAVVDTLEPVRGYWVRCSQQGQILLTTGGAVSP
ncbi:MAG: endonuclease [Bacteroidota bacterium]